MFKSQSIIQSIFTDRDAENATRQFNATSKAQADQFFAELNSQVQQFNASQRNAMAQFDVNQTNSVAMFNREANDAAEQFNANNRLIVDQSNAEWRRAVTTANNATINETNRLNATLGANMTLAAYNNMMQRERDLYSFAFTSGQNEENRANELAIAQMGIAASMAEAEAAGIYISKVKSYVKREGRLTKGQARAIEQYGPSMQIPFQSHRLDFNTVYAAPAPLVLEIGFGMGQSLVSMAQAAPTLNFLGIEVHRPGVGACLALAGERGLTNLKVIEHDAVEVLQHMIPDASLERLQLYFPDPWHKTRHHKRRIVQIDWVKPCSGPAPATASNASFGPVQSTK
jgi:hypothetical protein